MARDPMARVQAWVSSDLHRRLLLIADERDTSLAEVVRQLLTEAVEANEGGQR